MPYIYEPAGKAKEYADLALNLYDGCSHRCQYCYVPAALHRTRQSMAHASPRNIDMRKLEREIAALHPGSEVFLCFTCDPYQPLERETRVTRRVIEMLHAHEVGVKILTKAGRLSTRDFDLLSARPDLSAYGATLTFVSPASSDRWEPGAASPISRIRALAKAHGLGIPTWASLEPVIDPAQSLELIRRASPFVDKFKVGKWNHDARAKDVNWRAFVKSAVRLLRERGKPYYIKFETRPYLPEGFPAEWAGRQ